MHLHVLSEVRLLPEALPTAWVVAGKGVLSTGGMHSLHVAIQGLSAHKKVKIKKLYYFYL
jgi:hypothetical protein